jgi:tetratricopeptide (TPR) repeat protein
VNVGTAYLNADEDEKALAAFDRALDLSATPPSWNNIAYQLALRGAHLERAQQYAESAVDAMTATSRTFAVDRLSSREIAVMASLASYWDTLGWVFFVKGDVARAEKLVASAWLLRPNGEVGDHLGQIYQRQGRTADAVQQYALSLHTSRPEPETKGRLEKVAGSATEPAEAVRRVDERWRTFGSVTVESSGSPAGTADFVVLFNVDSSVEHVVFVNGDEPLRSLTQAIKSAKLGALVPDTNPAKLLRRGTATCLAGGRCTFTLTPLEKTQAVQ